MSETYLDGNAIGGLLWDVFGVEMTLATGVCGSCGAVNRVAELRVYVRAAGTVARCPSCDNVLLTVVEAPDRLWVGLHGLARLEVPRTET
jgi:hypothetical protein